MPENELILKAIESIHIQSDASRDTPIAAELKTSAGFRFKRKQGLRAESVAIKIKLRRTLRGLINKLYQLPVIGYTLKNLVIALRLRTRFDQVYQDQQSLREHVARLVKEIDNVDTLRASLAAELTATRSYAKELEQTILRQQKKLSDFAMGQDELFKLLDPTGAAAQPAADKERLESFYKTFEDRHRGSLEDIRNKQRNYIPYINKLQEEFEDMLCLDVGCGRGEWLQLLEELKLPSKGIDLDVGMVQACKEQGLDVEHADVLVYLSKISDNTFTMISGFHIVEHLAFPIAMKLIREAYRTLKPGGMLVLETPNPENLIVGSCNFYMDPTHRSPIPPPALHFMMDFEGFRDFETVRLSPMNQELTSPDPLVAQMAKSLYGAQDYAIIGHKPKA